MLKTISPAPATSFSELFKLFGLPLSSSSTRRKFVEIHSSWTWSRVSPGEALREALNLCVRINSTQSYGADLQRYVGKSPRSPSFVFFVFHSQTHSFNYHQSFSCVLGSVSDGGSAREKRIHIQQDLICLVSKRPFAGFLALLRLQTRFL